MTVVEALYRAEPCGSWKYLAAVVLDQDLLDPGGKGLEPFIRWFFSSRFLQQSLTPFYLSVFGGVLRKRWKLVVSQPQNLVDLSKSAADYIADKLVEFAPIVQAEFTDFVIADPNGHLRRESPEP